MRRTSTYIIGGLSIFALGYCTRSSCHSDPSIPAPPASQPSAPPVRQPTSPQQPRQPDRLAVQHPITSHELLFPFLLKYQDRLLLPPKPDHTLLEQECRTLTGDCFRLFKSVVRSGREMYQELSGETEQRLQEAKERLKEIYMGK